MEPPNLQHLYWPNCTTYKCWYTDNWAGFTTYQQATVTNPVTPVQFFNGTTPLGTTAPVTGITVTRYLNNVGIVAPGGTGTFTFQRRVN